MAAVLEVPFRRMAERDPVRASEVLRRMLCGKTSTGSATVRS